MSDVIAKTIIAAAFPANVTLPGFSPGDSICNDTSGAVRQIGIQAGVKYLRPDYTDGGAALAFCVSFFGAVVYTDPIPGAVKISGATVHLNGGVNEDIVTIYVTSAAALVGAVMVTGTLLNYVEDAGGTSATITVKTNAAGIFSLVVTGTVFGAAVWNVSSNVEALAQIGHAFT